MECAVKSLAGTHTSQKKRLDCREEQAPSCGDGGPSPDIHPSKTPITEVNNSHATLKPRFHCPAAAKLTMSTGKGTRWA